MQMKFFIDTANLDEIREAHALGLLDGVTTNPSLLSKEDGSPTDVIRNIAELVPGPVSAEVVAMDAEGMVREGLALREIADNIVVKIPMTLEGLKAIRTLTAQGIPTNCTLVFSATQAILAAKAGATFLSPFVGRLDDLAVEGMDLIEEIVEIYQNYDFQTEVLVASVRSPLHVAQAAQIGADVVTIPAKVFSQLASHPLTDLGLERFLADWDKVKDR
jgi:transaldolase